MNKISASGTLVRTLFFSLNYIQLYEGKCCLYTLSPDLLPPSLHLLSIAGSPDVGAVVGVLAAAVEQVSWQRGDDDFLQLPCSLYYSLCSCEGRELTLLGRHHCLALSVELAIG